VQTIRFACRPGCTACCEAEGFVYLTEEDLARAAAYLEMTHAEFERRYAYRMRHKLRLRKPAGTQCHFLESGGCSIHPAKPTQCRLYPLWPELVESARNWERVAKQCPGIGQGPLIQIEAAKREAGQMRRAYPFMYR